MKKSTTQWWTYVLHRTFHWTLPCRRIHLFCRFLHWNTAQYTDRLKWKFCESYLKAYSLSWPLWSDLRSKGPYKADVFSGVGYLLQVRSLGWTLSLGGFLTGKEIHWIFGNSAITIKMLFSFAPSTTKPYPRLLEVTDYNSWISERFSGKTNSSYISHFKTVRWKMYFRAKRLDYSGGFPICLYSLLALSPI